MIVRTKFLTVASLLMLTVLMISGVAAQGTVTLRYWMWDSLQITPYQECADVFQEEHPNIQIEIGQFGYGDYWTAIQTGFVTGDVPDVFHNQLARYPEHEELGQLVDIQPFVERDSVPTDIYIGDLAELWTHDGKRYGLPKDWDTLAVVYNVEMFESAGIDPAVMETWEWNPEDGGTFGEAIAMLSLDSEGRNGLDPDFDADNVAQWGYISRGGNSYVGHTEWSHWAHSNGFRYIDEPWSTDFHYDDPALAETLQWYADLALVQGFAPSQEEVSSLGAPALFVAGQGAMTIDGSWRIKFLEDNADFEIGYGRLPIGPDGRFSMFNGLADSIWIGTEHLEESWEWVKFLASPTCANIVGDSAVIFPAQEEATQAALDAHATNGTNVSAFVNQALETDGLYYYPITTKISEVAAIMGPVMESIMLGTASAEEALPVANDEVNSLYD